MIVGKNKKIALIEELLIVSSLKKNLQENSENELAKKFELKKQENI